MTAHYPRRCFPQQREMGLLRYTSREGKSCSKVGARGVRRWGPAGSGSPPLSSCLETAQGLGRCPGVSRAVAGCHSQAAAGSSSRALWDEVFAGSSGVTCWSAQAACDQVACGALVGGGVCACACACWDGGGVFAGVYGGIAANSGWGGLCREVCGAIGEECTWTVTGGLCGLCEACG